MRLTDKLNIKVNFYQQHKPNKPPSTATLNHSRLKPTAITHYQTRNSIKYCLLLCPIQISVLCVCVVACSVHGLGCFVTNMHVFSVNQPSRVQQKGQPHSHSFCYTTQCVCFYELIFQKYNILITELIVWLIMSMFCSVTHVQLNCHFVVRSKISGWKVLNGRHCGRARSTAIQKGKRKAP